MIRFHYLPGNIIVEYTPANGANGALISFDGDFLLLGNGYSNKKEIEIIFHYKKLGLDPLINHFLQDLHLQM